MNILIMQKIINLNKMKLRSTLPENVFILNEDSLPTLADSDPWGKIMVWRKDVGWSIIQHSEALQFVAMKHTHWTFTPTFPYNKSVTEQ